MQIIKTLFAIAALGYIIGNITYKGLQLGTSGVILIGLLFGHWGYEVPSVIQNLGLALFVTTVGLTAGPTFFRNFKARAFSFVVVGIVIIAAGAGTAWAVAKLFNIPSALAVGIFTGAMTSTPGLAAALEATGDTMASIGYGIAYPFGVLGVVFFVQVFPVFLRRDLKKEAENYKTQHSLGAEAEAATSGKARPIESSGMLVLSFCLVLGLLLAEVSLPLPGGSVARLGMSGGPLMIGLLLGHLGKIGRYSLKVPQYTLNSLRELGLMLFLAGAGTSAGKGFLAVAAKYGWSLFVGGAIITIIPMLIGYYIAAHLFRLDLLNTLGAVCGGMTSTPALGVLITASGTEDVAASYAATYPIALVLVITAAQMLAFII